MIDRRSFLRLLVAGPLTPPVTAQAPQMGKVYRIGFLASLPVPATGLADALRTVGLVEGQNVVIDHRLTESPEALPSLAGELVRLQPELIVAYWNRDVAAARSATQSIPIVIVVGVDPVGAGLVASLARPGGNVTGSLFTEPAIAEDFAGTERGRARDRASRGTLESRL